MADSTDANSVVKIGLLGYGTVGSSLAELLSVRRSALAEITGLEILLHSVAVRKPENYQFPDGVEVKTAQELVADPEVDVVVELIGGLEPARELILSSLAAGKPVVTGNKELIANHGHELFAAAKENQVDLLFEASTAGAIPILRPLRESLLGEDVRRVMGIVNGTTNYILTQMTETGASFDSALAEAQQLGFAEADPTADVEGHDAAAKAAIMASLAFGCEMRSSDVACDGITAVTADDITSASKLGYTIKLLATAGMQSATQASARVAPMLVPKTHPLASVRGSYNAVFVEGEASSELMFYGRGAGGKPTASAVLGDIVDAARNLVSGTHREVPTSDAVQLRSSSDDENSYYVVINTEDTPGVLSDVSGIFAKHNISISKVEQEPVEDLARIVFITQAAKESDFESLFAELGKIDSVKQIVSRIRVLD